MFLSQKHALSSISKKMKIFYPKPFQPTSPLFDKNRRSSGFRNTLSATTINSSQHGMFWLCFWLFILQSQQPICKQYDWVTECLIKLGLHLILILQAAQDMRFLTMLWKHFSGWIYFWVSYKNTEILKTLNISEISKWFLFIISSKPFKRDVKL